MWTVDLLNGIETIFYDTIRMKQKIENARWVLYICYTCYPKPFHPRTVMKIFKLK